MKFRIIASTIAVVAAGTFLHFAWELSGRANLVGWFAAMNESTWEHLKMAFWPAFALVPLHRWLYGPHRGLLPAAVVRTLLPSVLIVLLFYGYTSVTGANLLALDIGVFIVAILAGETAGHTIMDRKFSAAVVLLAAVGLVIAAVAFSTLSFIHPDFILFEDPLGRPHA